MKVALSTFYSALQVQCIVVVVVVQNENYYHNIIEINKNVFFCGSVLVLPLHDLNANSVIFSVHRLIIKCNQAKILHTHTNPPKGHIVLNIHS